jgi:hypothetical protein
MPVGDIKSLPRLRPKALVDQEKLLIVHITLFFLPPTDIEYFSLKIGLSVAYIDLCHQLAISPIAS